MYGQSHSHIHRFPVSANISTQYCDDQSLARSRVSDQISGKIFASPEIWNHVIMVKKCEVNKWFIYWIYKRLYLPRWMLSSVGISFFVKYKCISIIWEIRKKKTYSTDSYFSIYWHAPRSQHIQPAFWGIPGDIYYEWAVEFQHVPWIEKKNSKNFLACQLLPNFNNS